MQETLNDLLSRAAQVDERGYTFLNDALEPTHWSFRALHREAERRGRYLRSLGLRPGDRMAMVVPDGEQFVLSFLGAVRAGIVPVPMYPPLALGKLDSYIASTTRVLRTARVKALLSSKQVAPLIWSLIGKVDSLENIYTVERIRDHNDRQVTVSLDDVSVRPEDTCFLQFTSGSTSDPKGVVVTHANLVANAVSIMIHGLDSDPERDVAVSWLPLFHDMGLIGFVIAPLLNTVPIVFIPTLSFVKRPAVWMSTISRYRGTITFAPNFAFGLAAKRATPQQIEKLDLKGLRVLGCGAEPINAQTLRAFSDTFAPAGLSPKAVMPVYGMAEATLAISFDDLESPMDTVVIDRERYELEGRAELISSSAVTREAGPAPEERVMEIVSCGRAFPGHELGIMSPDGQLLEEGLVGEIVLHGPSVTPGYFENEEATRAAFQGRWLHTGDLGFIHRGRLYISGRIKDLIILNGRNYYPQSIEWEIEQVEGVRRGNVVAFSARGEHSERLVVVAETKTPSAAERSKLEEVIRKRVQESVGIPPSDVELLGPGALPKTSSGKVQRKKTQALYEDGSLGRDGNRTLGSRARRLALAKHITTSAVARITHEIRKPARTARRLVAAARRPETPRDR